VISGFHAVTISDTWASFGWQTDEPATCYIQWAESEPLPPGSPSETHTHLVMGDRVVVATNIKTSTVYYISVRSTDAYGNGSHRPGYHFMSAQAGGIGGEPVEE